MGSTGAIRLDAAAMDAMLFGGARWAVERGYGEPADLERIEEHGCMAGAQPREAVARAPQGRGVAEEAPDAYKDVAEVVQAAHAAGISKKVARLVPLICVKG